MKKGKYLILALIFLYACNSDDFNPEMQNNGRYKFFIDDFNGYFINDETHSVDKFVNFRFPSSVYWDTSTQRVIENEHKVWICRKEKAFLFDLEAIFDSEFQNIDLFPIDSLVLAPTTHEIKKTFINKNQVVYQLTENADHYYIWRFDNENQRTIIADLAAYQITPSMWLDTKFVEKREEVYISDMENTVRFDFGTEQFTSYSYKKYDGSFALFGNENNLYNITRRTPNYTTYEQLSNASGGMIGERSENLIGRGIFGFDNRQNRWEYVNYNGYSNVAGAFSITDYSTIEENSIQGSIPSVNTQDLYFLDY